MTSDVAIQSQANGGNNINHENAMQRNQNMPQSSTLQSSERGKVNGKKVTNQQFRRDEKRENKDEERAL